MLAIITFIIGFFVGGFIGVITCAIIKSDRDDD